VKQLREIFLYEVRYQVRSPSTWVFGGILFFFSISMFMAVADWPGLVNGPERLAWAYVRPGIFGILVTAALFSATAVRDVQAGMDPLVFTTPVRKAELLGGRFLATLAVNAALLLVATIPGIQVAMALAARSDPASIGALVIGAHLQAVFVFLLPNMVVVAAILFMVGMLSRHAVPVYLAAIGAFIGYVVTLNYASGIDSAWLATLVDPLGLVTLERTTRYWTEAERDSRLIGLPGPLALNRAFWLAVAAIATAVLHATFRFTHPTEGGRRRKGRASIVAPGTERARPLAVPRVAGAFGFRTTMRQTFAVARHSMLELTASRWFAVVLLACVGLTMLWGWNVGTTVFDTSTWPVTLLVAQSALAGRVFPLVLVLIALYAGELVWNERDVGVDEIADAVPVVDGATLLGRFLALAGMLVMIQAATMFGGILIQAFQGYYRFEFGVYVSVVFGLSLALYVLLAALAMTIHVVVNHKWLGHMVVLAAFLFIGGLAEALGIEHNLLVYAGDPGWTYSDMNGFGPFVGPFVWFRLYWAAWALLLLVVAVTMRVRGRESGLRNRLREARGRFRGPVLHAAGMAMLLILVLGGFVFYNTNVLNEYRSSDEAGASSAEYETRYGRYADLPQPIITSADLRVEIWPGEPAVDVAGSYDLANRTGATIDSVHIVFGQGVEPRSVSFDRDADAVLVDDEVGYRIYRLGRALEPGDTARLDFDVGFRPHGFRNDGIQTDVVANGTAFDRRRMLFVGYQRLFELTDAESRERFGLAPRAPTPGPEDAADAEARWQFRDADLVHANVVIGTAADQIAITPGVMREEWTENGRRYFRYETDEPTSFGATIWSAEYAVLEDRWNDVALRIFHHPAHDFNLDRMMRGLKASLEYLSTQFGPYPASELRLVEAPRYGGMGSAHPLTIAFTEDAFLSRVREGEVDQPFYGTAHEVAHTWWGGMVRGAPVRGAGFLTESLANYSAMMATEKTYGPDAARRVYDFQMERYLQGRASFGREAPLLEVADQPYIAYRKGAIALYTLRDHIGEEAVNAALHSYFDTYNHAGPPFPGSLDLYAELRAVTPDSLQSVLTDWFETITLWDVRTERATVERTGTGEYVVTMDVVAKKLRADSAGNETEVPMNDLVEIGVFGRDDGNGPGEPLHHDRHRIRSGQQTISVTVPREPARAGIDPYRKLIDRQRNDNMVRVEAAVTAGNDERKEGEASPS
jgi:ABC-type transport system involved in multi-copper enzyme maturation permease subunit